jgi:hypothetical protein
LTVPEGQNMIALHHKKLSGMTSLLIQ